MANFDKKVGQVGKTKDVRRCCNYTLDFTTIFFGHQTFKRILENDDDDDYRREKKEN